MSAGKGTPLLKLHLNAVDYGIVVAYFLVILLIGLRLRRSNNTSQQFLEAGRSLPLAISGIAFVAANCGSLEVMGMVSTSAKYGWRAVHFYWIGAVPAMLLLALDDDADLLPQQGAQCSGISESALWRTDAGVQCAFVGSAYGIGVGRRTVRDGADPASDFWHGASQWQR